MRSIFLPGGGGGSGGGGSGGGGSGGGGIGGDDQVWYVGCDTCFVDCLCFQVKITCGGGCMTATQLHTPP